MWYCKAGSLSRFLKSLHYPYPKSPSIDHFVFRPLDCWRLQRHASWCSFPSCQNDWQARYKILYGIRHPQSQGGFFNTSFILSGSIPLDAKTDWLGSSFKVCRELRLLILKSTAEVLISERSLPEQSSLLSSVHWPFLGRWVVLVANESWIHETILEVAAWMAKHLWGTRLRFRGLIIPPPASLSGRPTDYQFIFVLIIAAQDAHQAVDGREWSIIQFDIKRIGLPR